MVKRSQSRKPAAAPRPSTAKPPVETARAPTYDDLLAIVRLIESGSRFSEFRLRSGDIEVEIRRANGAAVTTTVVDEATSPPATAPAPTPASTRRSGAIEVPPGSHLVRSPMVGTFYRSPQPGAPPFVEPGQRVAADTVVCIIEVMKLMNSVAAGVAGTVTHIYVDNAGMVEYGQPLLAIRADA